MSLSVLRNDTAARLAALDRSQAIIEFAMDGTILTANANFLNAMGYTLDEIRGKHHSIFVEPAYRDSADYKEFWAKLNRGEFDAGQYKRLGKGGRSSRGIVVKSKTSANRTAEETDASFGRMPQGAQALTKQAGGVAGKADAFPLQVRAI